MFFNFIRILHRLLGSKRLMLFVKSVPTRLVETIRAHKSTGGTYLGFGPSDLAADVVVPGWEAEGPRGGNCKSHNDQVTWQAVRTKEVHGNFPLLQPRIGNPR
jgi:hypothetical protein